jgi:subtilisin family serine protease
LEEESSDLEFSPIEEDSKVKYKNRKLFRAIPRQIVDQLNVKYFWNKDITGKGIKVAIFDTGLEEKHPHFKNIIEVCFFFSKISERIVLFIEN